MKVYISYDELNSLINKKINQPIVFSNVDSNTIKVTYAHDGFIGIVDAKLKLSVPCRNHVSFVISSETPGVEKIVSGVIEFAASRFADVGFMSIEGNSVNIDLTTIQQLTSALRIASISDFIATTSGIELIISL